MLDAAAAATAATAASTPADTPGTANGDDGAGGQSQPQAPKADADGKSPDAPRAEGQDHATATAPAPPPANPFGHALAAARALMANDVTVPGDAQLVDEDTALTFGGGNGNAVQITSANGDVTVALSVSNGTLNLASTSGLTIDSGADGSGAVTFTGTQADVNAALDGLQYTGAGDFNGMDTLTVDASDLDGSAGQQTVTIEVAPVNDDPVLAPPAPGDSAVARVNEGDGNTVTLTPANFGIDATDETTLGAFDPDLDSNLSTVITQSPDQLTFELNAEPNPDEGRLFLNGRPLLQGSIFTLQDLIDGNVSYEQQGGQANDALNAGSEADSFDVTIRDGAGGTDAGTVNVAIDPVNQAPSPDVGTAGVTPFEGRLGVPVEISVADPDQVSGTYKIEFSNLNLQGGTLYRDDGDGQFGAGDTKIIDGFSFTGTLATLNSDLRLDISGDEPGTPISFDVSVTDDDGGTADAGATAADGTTATATLTIEQRENNDHPVLTTNAGADPGSPLSGATDQTRITLTSGMLDVTDVDSPADTIAFTLTQPVSNTNGTSGTAEIQIDNEALDNDTTFTLKDVQDGNVDLVFTGNGSGGETQQDFQFGFKIRDGELTEFSTVRQTVDVIDGGTRNDGDTAFLDHTNSTGLSNGNLPHQFNVRFNLSDPTMGETPAPGSAPPNQQPTVGTPLDIAANELDEDGTVSLAGKIPITDPDNTAQEITIRLESLPNGGTILLNGNPVPLFGSFTEAQLNAGEVVYRHDGGEQFQNANLGFLFSVSDGSADAVTPPERQDMNNFLVDATPINDTPTAEVNKQALIGEAGHVAFNSGGNAPTIALEDVDGSGDPDPTAGDAFKSDTGTADELTAEITALPGNGVLFVDSDGDGTINGAETALALNDTVKVSDVNAGRLTYLHDGTETFTDSFQLRADDRQGEANSLSNAVTVDIQIAPVNDDPTVDPNSQTDDGDPNTENTGLRVDEGGTAVISGTGSGTQFGGAAGAALVAFDPDNSLTQVQFRITDNVDNGELRLNGRALTAGSTFTQDDLDNGRVTYVHDGTEGPGLGVVADSFDFEVADAGPGETPTGTFEIEVENVVNDPPSVTVPAGPVDIDDVAAGGNAIAGVSVADPEADSVGNTDFLQVTVRLLDEAGSPLATGDYVPFTITSGNAPAESGSFEIDDTANGSGTFLELRGTRANVNQYLADLQVGSSQDLDRAFQLEVVVDDRTRDLATGALDATGDDANGGELNDNPVLGGAPTAVPGDTFDALTETVASETADGLNLASDSVLLRVSTEDDPATVMVPGAQTVLEDVPFDFDPGGGTAISVSDPESAGLGLDVTVTLNVDAGQVSVGSQSGVNVSNNDSASVTLTGAADDIDALLADGVSYTGAAEDNANSNAGAPGDVTLTVSLQESGAAIGQGGGGDPGDDTVSSNVALTIDAVNDQPTVSAANDITVGALPASNIDVDTFVVGDAKDAAFAEAGESDEITAFVRLTQTDGTPLTVAEHNGATLSATAQGGATLDLGNNGNDGADAPLSVTGTLADVNATLATLQLSVDTSFDPPGGGSNQDNSVRLELVVDDRLRDGGTGLVQADANGGDSNQDDAGGTFPTATDLAADVEQGLGAAPFNVRSAAAAVFLSSVNDPPRVTAGNASTGEGSATLTLAGGNTNFDVADPDDNGGDLDVTISVTTTDGPDGDGTPGVDPVKITGVGSVGGGNLTIAGDGLSATVTGVDEGELNALLNDVTVTFPDGTANDPARWNGAFDVTVEVDDRGNTGARPGDAANGAANLGDAGTDSGLAEFVNGSDPDLKTTRTVTVTVTPTNDAPVLSGTATDPSLIVQSDGTAVQGGPQALLQAGVTATDIDILADSDVTSFGGGRITVALDDYGAGDTLSLAGSPAGVAGTSGGSGSDLVIDLADDASENQVAAILEALRVDNGAVDPTAGDATGANNVRGYSIVLNDGNNNADAGVLDGTNDAGGPTALNSNTLTGTVTFRLPPTASDNDKTVDVDAANSVTGNLVTDDDGSGTDGDPEDAQGALAITDVAGTPVSGLTNVAGSFGTLAVDTDGSYTYTVDAGNPQVADLTANGGTLTDTFTYTLTDTDNTDDTATLTVTLTDDADPTATDNADAIALDQVTSSAGNIVTDDDGNGVDSDPDPSDTLSVTDVSGTAVVGPNTTVTGNFGTLTVDPDGSYSYDVDVNNAAVMNLAAGDAPLVETFIYTLDDGNGSTDTAGLTITISAGNGPPVATDNAGTVDEGGPISTSGNVLSDDDGGGADSDPNGDPLAVTQVDGGAGNVGNALAGSFGSVTVNADGSYSYTLDTSNPAVTALNDGDTLTDSFTYTVGDGNGGSDQASLTITIQGETPPPPNQPPVAADNSGTTQEDTPITFSAEDLLGNDSDPDGDALTVTGVGGSTNGSVSLSADGNATFTPDPGFAGTGSFTYTVADGNGGTATATVTIEIVPNAPPVALDDSGETEQDTPVIFSAGDLLGNDTDPEGDALAIIQVGNAINGSVTLDNAGNATFTPDEGVTGTGSFTYTIADGNGGVSTATVTIDIAASNQPPVAADDAGTTGPDTPVTFTAGELLGNDSDPDGDALTITQVGGATNGSVVLDGAGNAVFTPNAGFTGTGSFTYTIADGNGGTSTATVTIDIPAGDSDDDIDGGDQGGGDDAVDDGGTPPDDDGDGGTGDDGADGDGPVDDGGTPPTDDGGDDADADDGAGDDGGDDAGENDDTDDDGDAGTVVNAPAAPPPEADDGGVGGDIVTDGGGFGSGDGVNGGTGGDGGVTGGTVGAPSRGGEVEGLVDSPGIDFGDPGVPDGTDEGFGGDRTPGINPVRLTAVLGDRVLPNVGVQSFSLPPSTFEHTDPAAQISVEATRADGSPLPDFIVFDENTRTFTIDGQAAKAEGVEEIDVRVTGRDDDGNKASTTFNVTLTDSSPNAAEGADAKPPDDAATDTEADGGDVEAGTGEAADTPVGKQSLSDQLRQEGRAAFETERRALLTELEELLSAA